MAVPEQTPYIEHTGNGVTTSFSLEFQCESKDHLIVLVDEIEPPIATWSLTGGNVVFTTAPAAGKKITVQRNTPFGRATNYQSFNNSFRPQTVNKDFDWIWWKLQELGVADWILSVRIDALKNYVDRKDDELKAYLMEEIRKQGVALDQLDEYYNYLMERLAQIAVDKGWDSSFVVHKGKTQYQINNQYISTFTDFFSTSNLSQYLGSRVSTRDNSGAWDVVPFGTGDFDHDGVGLKIPSVFSGGMIPITVFGGVANYNETTKTGTPVDTAFNRLMAFCERTGATAQIVGKFYSKGGMKISKPVRIYANAEIYCDNSDNNIALEIGTTGTQFSTNGGPSRLKMEGRLDLRKIRNAAGQPFWWDNTDTTSIGSLEHALHGCSFGGFSVDGFNQNRVWESSGITGYANNNNFDCRCTNGRNNIFALVDDQGYVTENKWFSGLITNASSTPLAAANTVVSISLNTEEGEFFCDNNQFISVNIEDHTSAKVFQTNGQYNIIQNCRLEGVKNQSIHFMSGSLNNRLDQCFGIDGGKSSSKVLDEGINNFSGIGTIFQNAFSSYGVYMGANNTPAAGGGLGRYSVFGCTHKTDERYLATSVGQKGIGVWKKEVGLREFPSVWLDSELGRIQFGHGNVDPSISLRGRTDNVALTLGATGGTLGMGGLVMGGNFDKGHLVQRANGYDYHLWVDASGNLRFAKTNQDSNPSINTAGVIVATGT